MNKCMWCGDPVGELDTKHLSRQRQARFVVCSQECADNLHEEIKIRFSNERKT